MEDVSDSGQEEEEEEEESVVEDPPTPSIQRSATTTNVLELAEPIWLRDLDGRRKPPVVKSPPPMESPVWLAVKLRPTALSLVDPDPTGPTSDQTAQLHAHLRLHQRPARSSSCCAKHERTSQPHPPRSPRRKSRKILLWSRPERNCPKRSLLYSGFWRKKNRPVPFSSSSRESLPSADAASSVSVDTGSKLNHHRSIELMRMLEETPLVSSNSPLHDRMDSLSAVTETGLRPRRMRCSSPESRLRHWKSWKRRNPASSRSRPLESRQRRPSPTACHSKCSATIKRKQFCPALRLQVISSALCSSPGSLLLWSLRPLKSRSLSTAIRSWEPLPARLMCLDRSWLLSATPASFTRGGHAAARTGDFSQDGSRVPFAGSGNGIGRNETQHAATRNRRID